MADQLQYPQILMPGGLAKLNKEIIDRLGTPIFFAVPEPSRPRAATAIGMLYEIITGLYVTYHDHGDRLLDTYLNFCTCNAMLGVGKVKKHCASINELRNGLCHGNVPCGSYSQKLVSTIKKYFRQESVQWPDFLGNMTEEQCAVMVNEISTQSDQLVKKLIEWADIISKNPTQLSAWKDKLIEKALNCREQQYGCGSNYYNQRIVIDVAGAYPQSSSNNSTPRESIICTWLLGVERDIRGNQVKTASYLSDSLYDAFDQAYGIVQPKSASSDASLFDGLL